MYFELPIFPYLYLLVINFRLIFNFNQDTAEREIIKFINATKLTILFNIYMN